VPVSGRVIDRYVVIRELGRGGQSVVYLARHRELDRDVALKEIFPTGADPGFAARLLRELTRAASLRHSHIVLVHECFVASDTPYVVSEYVRGGSLRRWIGHLTLAQIAGVFEAILAALAHAHAQGVVHRDLKPENVLVTTEGRVKVADFEIANACLKAQQAGPAGLTSGTPMYMAPEQAMAREAGPWSDLYAVGVMAYELVLGTVPFHDAEEPGAILVRHVNEPPPSPRSIDPSLDPELAAWIERLLEKNPAARPSNAQEAWDDLEAIIMALLGARWRREARFPSQTVSPRSPGPLEPAAFEEPPAAKAPRRLIGAESSRLRGPELSVLLRVAARTGIVPADAAPAPPSVAPPAAAEPEPDFDVEPVAEPTSDVDRAASTKSYQWPAARRHPQSLLARVVGPLIVLGAVAAAAKWLLGLFVEWEEAGLTASDFVQCTVFAPPSATPDDQILVQVFVHLPEEAEDARAIASELDTDARKRAFRSLESPVHVGSSLEFELQLPGLQIDDPIASIVWHRRTEAVQFGVTVPATTATGTIIGTVSVSVDSAPVGHVKFKLAIEREALGLPSEPQGEEAHRYRFAFISYSSKDRDEVLRRVQLLSVVGIEYFQDVLSLEPGDRWLKRIELGIDACDLFLLFWSSDAKQSDWIRQEVQHALARKGGNDLSPPEIRPVVLEGPPTVEPWEELAHLHFNDRILYFIRPQARHGRCRVCGYRNEEGAEFCGHCGGYLRWNHKP